MNSEIEREFNKLLEKRSLKGKFSNSKHLLEEAKVETKIQRINDKCTNNGSG